MQQKQDPKSKFSIKNFFQETKDEIMEKIREKTKSKLKN